MQFGFPQANSLPIWGIAGAGVVLIEVAWMGLLYPLVPTTPMAWAVTLLLPIPIAVYVGVAVRGMIWIADRPGAAWHRPVAIALALSVGVACFFVVYLAESYLPNQFHYGLFRYR
jgi:hypothetical protein